MLTKQDNFCILYADQKNLQKQAIKNWSTLLKHANNLYKHWK